ncbi:MAG: class I SAM-dependent methyltransferase [Planctomycetes bacterium]|nr:class I SAM-dependent methyltransferase [Planctomycetota bacterium]
MMVAKGFNPKNIRGIDLISYSPWVDSGDMHKLPYGDGEFDAVVCGWTLSYSSHPDLAAMEMMRVVKKGGVVAVGVEYCSDIGEVAKVTGYAIEDDYDRKLNSVNDLLGLFKDRLDHVYFSHDAPLRVSHSAAGVVGNPSSVAVVFSITQD